MRSGSTSGAANAVRKLRRSRAGRAALKRARLATVVLAGSKPANSTPGCAASHSTAATDGELATICTSAAETSAAACAT